MSFVKGTKARPGCNIFQIVDKELTALLTSNMLSNI
jgi:hypothetical protein